ncbi:MAG: twin-arginine translocase subunit TatB [Alphaproteobacteria bacterium]|nr:twin-arginine translocase subunit TatB [Alphaproteobacteria bacterium]
MLDVSWSELLLILVVAFFVIGPKDLPKVMRTVGEWVGKARSMARQFTDQFYEMERHAQLDEVRRNLESIAGAATRELNDPIVSDAAQAPPPVITATPVPTAPAVIPGEDAVEAAADAAEEKIAAAETSRPAPAG